jgi:hypothetical protein
VTEFDLLTVPYRVKWRGLGVTREQAKLATEPDSSIPMEFETAAGAQRYVDEQNALWRDRIYWVVDR